MTLTRLLNDRRSPLREFFEQRLPNHAEVRARWTGAGRPSILPAGDRPPWAYLATAFDYRVRYFFTVTHPDAFAAAVARTVTGNPDNWYWRPTTPTATRDAYANLRVALIELTDRASPVGRVLGEHDERSLCRLCYVLALYEAVYRSGRSTTSPLATVPPDASAAEQTALVDEAWVDDLVALAGAFAPFATNLSGRRVVANPVFSGSGDVGGADGDLIVGSTLLEIKTTKRRPKREWVDQLIGYLLLDYDDAYGIEQLGFYISRVPALITWRVDDLLASLAGRPVDRIELRAAFRAALETARAGWTTSHRARAGRLSSSSAA